MTDAWVGLIGNVVNAILSAGIGAGVALFVSRRGRIREEAADARASALRRKEEIAALIEPLYQDLGTLVHLSRNSMHVELMAKLGEVGEKEQRGQYHRTSLPAVFQFYWHSLESLWTAYRQRSATQAATGLQDRITQQFLDAHMVGNLAQNLQAALRSFQVSGEKSLS